MLQETYYEPQRFSYMSFGGLKERDKLKFLPRIDAEDIIKAVLKFYNIQYVAFAGRGRRRSVVNARHVSMYLIRKKTKLSLKETGDLMGLDHTSVIHGIGRLRDLMETEQPLREEVLYIEETLL